MARLELESLRRGLRAIVQALPAITALTDSPAAAPCDDQPAAGERPIAADQRITQSDTIAAALKALGRGLSYPKAADASGLSDKSVMWLARLQAEQPGLLRRVLAGDLTIYTAAQSAGLVKRRPSTATGAHKGRAPTWPPKSASQWRMYERVKAADADVAIRVEKCELSVTAAAHKLGLKKHCPSRRQRAISC